MSDTNYTTPANEPFGARVSEFVIRQLIGHALSNIRKRVDDTQENIIDELFAMFDVAQRKQVKDYLRTHTNIPVLAWWPADDLSVPCIAVENVYENEDERFTFMGDRTGAMRLGVLGGQPLGREQRGVGLSVQSRVTILSDDPLVGTYLYYLVRFILFSNKDNLTRYYDMHNLRIDGAAVQLDQRLEAKHTWARAVTLTYQTMFDFNLSAQASALIDVGLQVTTGGTVDAPGVSVGQDGTTVGVPDPDTGA